MLLLRAVTSTNINGVKIESSTIVHGDVVLPTASIVTDVAEAKEEVLSNRKRKR
jgi:hypothetical protein